MATDSSLVSRGLLLLGFVLLLVAVVGFILFRPAGTAPEVQAQTLKKEPSKPGWEVRYNAAVALARRGSGKLPCAVIAEMLDEHQQLRNHVDENPEGVEVVDEQAARRTVVNALVALTEWHKHKDAVKMVAAEQAAEWQRVNAAIDKLTESDNAALREEARKFKKAIGPQ